MLQISLRIKAGALNPEPKLKSGESGETKTSQSNGKPFSTDMTASVGAIFAVFWPFHAQLLLFFDK